VLVLVLVRSGFGSGDRWWSAVMVGGAGCRAGWAAERLRRSRWSPGG